MNSYLKKKSNKNIFNGTKKSKKYLNNKKLVKKNFIKSSFLN